ncbi:3-oxoacyl-ACP synthase [Anaerosporomusa subterranea]|uniref:3-oxoacyl-ACP synthase n=1 Tax=Anaerosporomusa subterranea TaxID=1794912 RepID=A0A154BP81_ANASB|nr:ketoacyl-ACP synthase III [Anaerosporomusa subterranea]KYZ75823.1 3-oxoacyl-ACP synthase [Anaerosporomusa subterranea]
MRRARISGVGMWVPPLRLTNEELGVRMGKPVPLNIETKLGIKARHITGDDFSSADLGTEAAKAALANAGLNPEDIDMVIVTSDTPEYISPPTSAVVQGRLGAVNAGIFDVNASCTGFVATLDLASRMIGYDQTYKHILVVGTYNMTKFVDFTNEKVAPIFADGGGAVVLSATEADGSGYLSAKLVADGTQYDFLGIYAGGTKNPISHEAIDKGEHLLTFLKPLPGDRNVKLWPPLIDEALKRAGLTLAEVKHLLFTQINKSVIEEVMGILGLPMSQTTCSMDKYGYTGSACIPIALHEAVEAGSIQPGDIVVMVGSGVGLSSGAVIFRW